MTYLVCRACVSLRESTSCHEYDMHVQHMESLKREIEKLKSEAKHGSGGRMLEEVDKYRKANDTLHATVIRLEAGSQHPVPRN